MPMTKEEGEMLRKEVDAFTLTLSRQRIEFELVHWHVVMYRIAGQSNLIRVDLHEKSLEWKGRASKALEELEVTV